MDLFGRGYVLEHCMSTLNLQNQENTYRYYLTNALQYIVNNTAGQEQRMMLKKSYSEIASPSPKEKEQEENAEEKGQEIIGHMKSVLSKL